jgi:hypothetical protein
MPDVCIDIFEEELVREIYQPGFLKGLEDAIIEVASGDLSEVGDYDDFIRIITEKGQQIF